MAFDITINGAPHPVRASFAVHDPATGAVAGEAPKAGLEDLDRAVAAARAAFPGWAQPRHRARLGRSCRGTGADPDARAGQAVERPWVALGNGRRASLGRSHGRAALRPQGAAWSVRRDL